MFDLSKSKRLVVYTLLLKTFQEYCDRFPGSGISKYLDYFLEIGKKIVPSDERAQDILLWVLTCGTSGEAVAVLCGKQFTDLPVIIRPSYKDGDVIKIAHWGTKEKNYNNIFSLLGWDGDTHREITGGWVTSDVLDNGKAIKLLNNDSE